MASIINYLESGKLPYDPKVKWEIRPLWPNASNFLFGGPQYDDEEYQPTNKNPLDEL